MESYRMRLANRDDLPFLLAFYQVYASPFVPQRFPWAWEKSLEDRDVVLVSLGQEIVAAGALFNLSDSGVFEISSLLKAPTVPKALHIGREVITALVLNRALNLPSDRFCASTKAANVPINKIFERLGFSRFSMDPLWIARAKKRPTIIDNPDTQAEVLSGKKYLWTLTPSAFRTLAIRFLSKVGDRLVETEKGEIVQFDDTALPLRHPRASLHQALVCLALTPKEKLSSWHAVPSLLAKSLAGSAPWWSQPPVATRPSRESRRREAEASLSLSPAAST